MQLQLRQQTHQNHDISGAYIEGSIADWFAEISMWHINPLTLKIYLVPQNIANPHCKGILIMFNGEIPKRNTIRYPYKLVSDGFLIPLTAKLYPEITAEEVSTLKLWDMQFFHPHIGLVGFEYQDARELSSLIEITAEEESQWINTWPAISALPRLQSVVFEQDMKFDAAEHLKSLIDSKPLNEIPSLDDQQGKRFSKLRKMLRPLINLGIWIMLIFAFVGKIILQLIHFLLPKAASSIRNMAQPNLLQRLDSWIDKQMGTLEKQRDSELNRLVKLFDKDKNKALQYAIPLNSAYLNRGKALSTAKLIGRRLNFNFGNLGMGGATDFWDIGNYERVLRERYEKVASEAIADQDYKRAAYVYIHLLGDFFRGAATLQDGKHYREAAAIYKDHVKNNLRAAQCLEEGGLLNEAIELYIKQEYFETVGDLYLKLDQPDKAAKYFEEVISRALEARDNLKAAEVIKTKFEDLERSQMVLLDGWKNNNKPEQCLSRYFEIVVARELSIIDAVKEFHTTHVSRTKSTNFLNVLADLVASSENKELKEEALTICYQIAHQQINYGDFNALKILGRFMPDDRIIDQDVHRYVVKHTKQIRHQSADYHIQLEVGTVWSEFCTFHDQLIAIGKKEGNMRLLRMNWDEKIEYTYLSHISAEIEPMLISDSSLFDEVLVISPEIANRKEQLPATNFFERSATFHQINWLEPNTIGATLDTEGNVSSLVIRGEELLLHTHDLNGKNISSCTCTLEGYVVNANELPLSYSKLFWRKEHLYFIGRDVLMRVDEIGMLQILHMESFVLNFSISVAHTALKIAVLTVEGCMIVMPTLKEMVIGIPLFGQDLFANLVQLLPNNYVVLAAAQKAQVYELSGNKAVLLFEVVTDHDIQRILVVPKRNHFALVEADNKISIFVIP